MLTAGLIVASALSGCKTEDPTLTAAPPVAADAKPATPNLNKDRGEEAPTGASGGGGSAPAAPAAAPAPAGQ